MAFEKYTFFGRGEFVYKDELFREGNPFDGKIFSVGKAEAGLLYDFLKTNNLSFGIGYSAGLVFYSDDLDGDYVRIEFSDNGIGIPDKNLQKIFEPFFTTKKSDESKSGTGVVFYVVY